ncbi:hypothetical protein TWF506_004058 [Arthrobotrys conoides]|uniref:3'-5' exonuclease domain-containing protein n=1 Tax=Arthrobotrys conoides TaxID=74498 RepID=A0AAN8N742_9PEZI
MSEQPSETSPGGLGPTAPAFTPGDPTTVTSLPGPVPSADQLPTSGQPSGQISGQPPGQSGQPFAQLSAQPSGQQSGQPSGQQHEEQHEYQSEGPSDHSSEFEWLSVKRALSDPPDKPLMEPPLKRARSGPPDISGPPPGPPPPETSSELLFGQPSDEKPLPNPPNEPQSAHVPSSESESQPLPSQMPSLGLPSVHRPPHGSGPSDVHAPNYGMSSGHTPAPRVIPRPLYTGTCGPPSIHRPPPGLRPPSTSNIPGMVFQPAPTFAPAVPLHRTIPIRPAIQTTANAPPGLSLPPAGQALLSPPIASSAQATSSSVSTPVNDGSTDVSVSNQTEGESQQSEAGPSPDTTASNPATLALHMSGYTPFIWVNRLSRVATVVDAICNLPGRIPKPPSVCLGVKGYKLSRFGTISLMTIYLSAVRTTYVIDMHRLGSDVFSTPGVAFKHSTLKRILEDPEIKLIIYDCRNINDALYSKYGVDLSGVIDVQLYELALTPQRNRMYLKSLASALEHTRVLSPAQLERWKRFRDVGDSLLAPPDGICAFHERPVRPDILEYCVQDVVHLPGIYWNLFRQILASQNSMLWEYRIDHETTNRLNLAKAPYYDGSKTNEQTYMAPSSWLAYND